VHERHPLERPGEAGADSVRFDIIVSLDGISRSTFESVRLGADFGRVMENLGRFKDYTSAAGTRLTVNHCLMPQNYRELGDLLLFADGEDLQVDIQVVRAPTQCSIERLPESELWAIANHLQTQSSGLTPRLGLNRPTWLAEVARVTRWAENRSAAAEGTHVELRESILMFRRSGSGYTNPAAAVAEQRGLGDGNDVFSFVVGIDERIAGCPPGLARRFGAELSQLEGQPVTALLQFVSRLDQVAEDPDRSEFLAHIGQDRARLVFVANRDRSGRADDVVAVVSFCQAV